MLPLPKQDYSGPARKNRAGPFLLRIEAPPGERRPTRSAPASCCVWQEAPPLGTVIPGAPGILQSKSSVKLCMNVQKF